LSIHISYYRDREMAERCALLDHLASVGQLRDEFTGLLFVTFDARLVEPVT